MILDMSPAEKILKEGGCPTYFYVYIIYFSFIPFCSHITCHLKLAHTWKSVWNISYFRPSRMGFGPEEIVIVLIANSLIILHILYQTNWYKFLMSTHKFGFRILGFYHRVQWRGAKTAGKECWGPCHGLIPSLWDFAQNCSLQIECRYQNWRGTFYRFRESS